jgi:hypothetical protein
VEQRRFVHPGGERLSGSRGKDRPTTFAEVVAEITHCTQKSLFLFWRATPCFLFRLEKEKMGSQKTSLLLKFETLPRT